MTARPSPEAVLAAVGGAANVSRLSHCFIRLRFELVDPDAADTGILERLPGVAVVVWQAGELHIAPSSGLLDLHAAIAERL